MTNALYYGGNRAVLRESIADETVDLVYLDPPFNSNASNRHERATVLRCHRVGRISEFNFVRTVGRMNLACSAEAFCR